MVGMMALGLDVFEILTPASADARIVMGRSMLGAIAALELVSDAGACMPSYGIVCMGISVIVSVHRCLI